MSTFENLRFIEAKSIMERDAWEAEINGQTHRIYLRFAAPKKKAIEEFEARAKAVALLSTGMTRKAVRKVVPHQRIVRQVANIMGIPDSWKADVSGEEALRRLDRAFPGGSLAKRVGVSHQRVHQIRTSGMRFTTLLKWIKKESK
jgi:hypothetical protein